MSRQTRRRKAAKTSWRWKGSHTSTFSVSSIILLLPLHKPSAAAHCATSNHIMAYTMLQWYLRIAKVRLRRSENEEGYCVKKLAIFNAVAHSIYQSAPTQQVLANLACPFVCHISRSTYHVFTTSLSHLRQHRHIAKQRHQPL